MKRHQNDFFMIKHVTSRHFMDMNIHNECKNDGMKAFTDHIK